jgi:hypothetical protein
MKKDAEWVLMPHTRKPLQRNDQYVLGHAEVRMPPIVATSTLKGIKMRLVEEVNAALSKPTDKAPIKVIKEWEFTEDNQTIPISLDNPIRFNNTLWIEALNTSPTDANVNAMVHGMFQSKSL